MITKVEGFILSTVNYGESSLVINLFTKEYGIIGLMGKGVKSLKNKLHALTQRYTYGFFYIFYKENKLSILKEVDLINPLRNLHEDLFLISYLSYLSDLTNQVFKQSNDSEIYDLFMTTILKMNEGYDPYVLTNILEVKYLKYLGIELRLDCCEECGSKTNIITIVDGGLVCQNCFRGGSIVSPKTIQMLRLYNLVDIAKITKINFALKDKEAVNLFLEKYYQDYTGLYLKSKDFLTKLKETF